MLVSENATEAELHRTTSISWSFKPYRTGTLSLPARCQTGN